MWIDILRDVWILSKKQGWVQLAITGKWDTLLNFQIPPIPNSNDYIFMCKENALEKDLVKALAQCKVFHQSLSPRRPLKKHNTTNRPWFWSRSQPCIQCKEQIWHSDPTNVLGRQSLVVIGIVDFLIPIKVSNQIHQVYMAWGTKISPLTNVKQPLISILPNINERTI